MSMGKAVVIGSGAGGSFAAMELARAGWQVVVFEKGANHFSNLGGEGPIGTAFANDSLATQVRNFPGTDPEVFPRTWRPNQASAVQYTGSVDELPQLVGGGTVHWDAKMPRFWDIDFQQLSALGPAPGADVADWPFGYAEIASFYDEVEQLIGVQGDTQAFPDIVRKHAPRTRQYPMPPGPQQRSSIVVAAGATAIGLHPYPFPMAINSQPYNEQHACNNCGFCSGFGCPVVARPAALIPLRQALRTGRVQLVPETMVTKVLLDRGRAGHRGELDPDDRTRSGNRLAERRYRRDGGVGHRDGTPRAAVAVPGPERQTRPPADVARLRGRHRDLSRRADARLPRPHDHAVRGGRRRPRLPRRPGLRQGPRPALPPRRPDGARRQPGPDHRGAVLPDPARHPPPDQAVRHGLQAADALLASCATGWLAAR